MAGNSSVSKVFRAILPHPRQHGLGWEQLRGVQGRKEPAVFFYSLGMNADVEEAPQPSCLAQWTWSCSVAE